MHGNKNSPLGAVCFYIYQVCDEFLTDKDLLRTINSISIDEQDGWS